MWRLLISVSVGGIECTPHKYPPPPPNSLQNNLILMFFLDFDIIIVYSEVDFIA